MPVKDTIKVADAHGFAESTPDRSLLWQVQTPQAFAYPLVRGAYDRLMADETLQKGITDDAMVVEHLSGTKVRLVEGSYENLKVTHQEDLVLAEALLKKRFESVNDGKNFIFQTGIGKNAEKYEKQLKKVNKITKNYQESACIF